jgi:autotransporter-associated beta strand protein
VGTGVLTLAAANTHSGATTISAGRLEIGSGGAINSSSGVTVNGAGAELKYNSATALTSPLTLTQGILSGTGAINTAVTVGANAIIAPGNSPGIQTYLSSVWSPSGTYQWELNALTGTAGTNWDQVAVTTTLDLNGLSSENKFNLDLITLTGTTPGVLNFVSGSYTFPIATYSTLIASSTTPNSDLTSLFAISLANWQGTKPAANDISVKVNSTGTGLDLVIVPEPATLAMAGLGIAVVVGTLRRRRRTA